MASRPRLFDDVSRLAGEAATALGGLKGEIEAMMRQRLEKALADLDLVRRDEFEAVKEMAAKARSGQESLAKRLAALEAKLGVAAPAAKKPAAGKTAAKKAAPKKPSPKKSAPEAPAPEAPAKG